ncbi:MAG: nucleoside deaminase [Bacteroidota bacterium]|nr:nucleoside deaminase [Bacteroidota bacterium]
MPARDEYFMQQALKEAQKAYDEGEVPIGAVIVMQDKIITRAYNQVEKLNDSTAHAEVIAITSAYNFLGSKYLPDATLYVTIEPCFMCAGALYWSKIAKVVYGADDEKNGALTLTFSSKGEGTRTPYHPKTEIVKGICKEECTVLIKQFFKERR